MKLKMGHMDVEVRAFNRIVSDAEGAWGMFVKTDGVIYVAAELTPADQASVLIHEIIHACFWAFDLKDKDMSEENVCEALDGPLATVIRDNPKLLTVLQAALTEGKPIVTERKGRR